MKGVETKTADAGEAAAASPVHGEVAFADTVTRVLDGARVRMAYVLGASASEGSPDPAAGLYLVAVRVSEDPRICLVRLLADGYGRAVVDGNYVCARGDGGSHVLEGGWVRGGPDLRLQGASYSSVEELERALVASLRADLRATRSGGTDAECEASSSRGVRNHPCHCGSGKKFKKCCVFNGPRLGDEPVGSPTCTDPPNTLGTLERFLETKLKRLIEDAARDEHRKTGATAAAIQVGACVAEDPNNSDWLAVLVVSGRPVCEVGPRVASKGEATRMVKKLNEAIAKYMHRRLGPPMSGLIG